MSAIRQVIELHEHVKSLQATNDKLVKALDIIYTLLEYHVPQWYLRKHYNLIKQTLDEAKDIS